MKKHILIILIFCANYFSFGQSLQMTVNPSCAGNTNPALQWTCGEVTIFTGASANNYLTQGFQQPNTPGIDISILGDTVFCVGDSFEVTFNAFGIFGTSNVFNVLLSDANGSFGSAVVIGSSASSPVTCVIPTGLVSGANYAIQITSTAPVFTSNVIGSLDIFALPTVSISSLSSVYCLNSTADLTAEGALNYVWSNNAISSSINVVVDSDTTFSVVGTDVNGCSSSASINLTVGSVGTEICNGIDDDCDAQIDEGFDADADGFTSCNGDCDDNNNAVYPGAVDIDDNIDNDCDGLIDENADSDGDGYTPEEGDCNDSNPNIYPGATEICNELDDDCDTLIDEDLDCEEDFFIPNGISPNADGINDQWLIQGLDDYPNCDITVVNRWEQTVYHSTGYAQPWDGTYNGQALPVGDYFYVIKLTEDQVFTGFVSIKN